MRRVIAELLEQDPAIRVVGKARDGREAIALVQELRPDIVTMDVRMPVMDGLATTEYLMAYCPTPILVLTASLAKHDIDITFKMLGAGALEVIEKPSGGDPAQLTRTGHELIRRIKILSRVKVVTHLRGRRRLAGETPAQRPAAAPQARARTPSKPLALPAVARPDPGFPIVVIGASTGGPRIVNQVLSGLKPSLGAAVLVVQHIAAGFSSGMAEWLAHACRLPVHMAREGQPIQPGEVLIAPDQLDLLITPECSVHLSANPLLIQRPSIDISMQAAAEVFGMRAVGVLLTGMGRDGAYGMLTIRRAGGYTIAQDEASSTIFGMPRAAIELNAACDVLPAGEIATRLSARLQPDQRSALSGSARGGQ